MVYWPTIYRLIIYWLNGLLANSLPTDNLLIDDLPADGLLANGLLASGITFNVEIRFFKANFRALEASGGVSDPIIGI
jgi:hypothetical protein